MNGPMRSARVAMTPGVTAVYNWTQFPVIADMGGAIAPNWRWNMNSIVSVALDLSDRTFE